MKLSLYDGYFFDSEEIYLVRKNLVTKKKEENLEIEKKDEETRASSYLLLSPTVKTQ